MKRVNSWISTDFEDDAFSGRRASFKRPRGVAFGGRAGPPDLIRPWSVIHRPRDASALAVHPKKVQEVRQWLRSRVDKEKKEGGLLLLRGPPGCGKTATVLTLATELRAHVQEWSSPDEVVQFRPREADDVFIPNVGDQVPYVGHAAAFKNFMLRANRYRALGEEGFKLVLVEEVPSFARRNPSEFHSILRQVKSAGRYPLIVIDSGKSGFLLPEDVAASLEADVISFNPVSTTSLVKTLKAIADDEEPKRRGSFSMPDKEALASLAESSGGDIRAAINALQFACLKGIGSIKECLRGSSVATSTKKKKANGSRASKKQDLAIVGAKDPNLDLFHAIGKVLYSKRHESCGERETLVVPRLRRPPLISTPEEVVERAPMGRDTFVSFLHQSYPEFFTSVADLAEASEYMSLADPFFTTWDAQGKVSLSEYGGLVATRGICFSNRQVAKLAGAKTFHKPAWFQHHRLRRERMETLGRVFGRSDTDCSTLLIPVIGKYFSSDLPTDLAKVAFFYHRTSQEPREKVKIHAELDQAEENGDDEDAADFFIEED